MDNPLGPSSLLAQISTLRFPPAPLNAAMHRDVFNRLSAMETFNYTVTGDGIELVTPPREGGAVTRVAIGRDAVAVGFDPTTGSASFVAEQLTAILKELAAVLPVPVFIHQVHVVRKTIPLAGGADAREFLSANVLPAAGEAMRGWKRPPAALGARFVFAPQNANEMSSHDIRVESFLQDPRKIFVENAATFLIPLPAGQWDQLKANLAEANRFLDEHALSLLRGPSGPQ